MPRTKTTIEPKKQVTAEAVVETKPAAKAKKHANTLEVFDLKGNVVETVSLPDEIFAAKVNSSLMAQAVRVYLANQRRGTVSTKSRGEVVGSTRKIYRQKGTGRARHGGIRAPIFVGGGVALGPKPRDFSLSLPQKMKRAALFSALTVKKQSGNIKVITGLETLEPKTKAFAEVLKNLTLKDKKKILLVLPTRAENVQRAARNIEGVSYVLANQLNTYDVLNTKTVLMTKDAVAKMQETFLKG